MQINIYNPIAKPTEYCRWQRKNELRINKYLTKPVDSPFPLPPDTTYGVLHLYCRQHRASTDGEEKEKPFQIQASTFSRTFCSTSAHSEAEAPRITCPTIMSAQEESSSRLVARRERSAPAAVDRKAAAPVPFTSGVRCCPFSPVWSGLVHGDWWMRPLVVGAWMVWMGSSVRCCCCCRCCWWWTEKAGRSRSAVERPWIIGPVEAVLFPRARARARA